MAFVRLETGLEHRRDKFNAAARNNLRRGPKYSRPIGLIVSRVLRGMVLMLARTRRRRRCVRWCRYDDWMMDGRCARPVRPTDRPSVRSSVQSCNRRQWWSMRRCSRCSGRRNPRNSFRSSLVVSVPTAFCIRRKSGSVRSAINIPNWRIATRLFLSLTLNGGAQRRPDVARLIVIYYHRETEINGFFQARNIAGFGTRRGEERLEGLIFIILHAIHKNI